MQLGLVIILALFRALVFFFFFYSTKHCSSYFSSSWFIPPLTLSTPFVVVYNFSLLLPSLHIHLILVFFFLHRFLASFCWPLVVDVVYLFLRKTPLLSVCNLCILLLSSVVEVGWVLPSSSSSCSFMQFLGHTRTDCCRLGNT